jgi:hypothetical protein
MAIVNIRTEIKPEIVEKAMKQIDSGYCRAARGEWFVADGEKVMHHGHTTWTPWPGTANVISVEDLVFGLGGITRDEIYLAAMPRVGETDEQAHERVTALLLNAIPPWYDTATLEQLLHPAERGSNEQARMVGREPAL